MDSSSLKEQIRRGIHVNIGFKTAGLAIGFCFQILVVKLLSPTDYASYAILFAAMSFGEGLLSFGIYRSVLRFAPSVPDGATEDHRFLIRWLISARAVTVTIFSLAILLGAQWANGFLPDPLQITTIVALWAWCVATVLFLDLEAVAQSWMAQVALAKIFLTEIIVKFAATIGLFIFVKSVSVGEIVIIYASTMTGAVLLLCVRLVKIFRQRKAMTLDRELSISPDRTRAIALITLSNYTSTLSWLVSSSPVVRLITSLTLPVTTFAAFAFIQAFCISIQRALPGSLLLPGIEPIIMARLATKAGHHQAFNLLSLIFKMDLLFIACGVICSGIAGREIVTLLSIKEYAEFSFLLPILLVTMSIVTIYRIFEIVAAINFMQKRFLLVWPASVVSMLALYIGGKTWGIVGVATILVFEGLARVCILAFLLRRYDVLNIFDRKMTALTAMLTVAIVAGCNYFSISLTGAPRFYVAAGGVLLFLCLVSFTRPLRAGECDAFEVVVPASWRKIRSLARGLT